MKKVLPWLAVVLLIFVNSTIAYYVHMNVVWFSIFCIYSALSGFIAGFYAAYKTLN